MDQVVGQEGIAKIFRSEEEKLEDGYFLTPSVVTDTDSYTQTEKDKCAHIVKTDKNQTATALVLQALGVKEHQERRCAGNKWVPSVKEGRIFRLSDL